MSATTSAAGQGQGGKESAEACFNDCDAPYDIVGKGSAIEPLCEDGSEFREAYAACVGCVKESAGEAHAAVTELIPGLASIVSHCTIGIVSSTMTIVKTDGKVSTMVLLVDEPASTTQDAASRSWGSGLPPWGTGTPPWGEGPPPWVTGRPGGRGRCPDENATIPPEYASYVAPWCSGSWVSGAATPPPTTLSTAERTFSTPAETPTNDPAGSGSASETSTSKAWIAGPVIGAVLGLALLLGIIFFWRWRRRRQAAAASAAATELETEKAAAELQPENVYEMEGSTPVGPCAEKPANEFPAKELAG